MKKRRTRAGLSTVWSRAMDDVVVGDVAAWTAVGPRDDNLTPLSNCVTATAKFSAWLAFACRLAVGITVCDNNI